MRLTDEERAIADDVARHHLFSGADSFIAWRHAMNYIAARREAFGNADDGEETLPDGVLAKLGRLHRAALLLYGHHWSCDTLTPAEQADAWAALRDALCLPPGTATAAGVGADDGTPRGVVVTDEQLEAVQTARVMFAQGGEFLGHAADRARAVALDGLLAAIDVAKGGAQ